MSSLNSLKYAALAGLTGGEGTLNELEHLYLTQEGVPEIGTLNERWYALFDRPGVTWNEGAHIWLTTKGVPEGGTLNERWYWLWDAVVNSPPLPSVVIYDPTNINHTGTTALQAVVNWTIAPDGDFPVSSTEIKREGQSDVWAGPPTAKYTDTRDIVPDTAIKYTLTTIDTEGNRSVGVESSVGIPNLVLPGKPAAPTAGSYSTIDKDLRVNWGAATQGTFAIANYKLYRNGVLRATLGVVLNYVDDVPFDDSFDTYQYRVSAVDSSGNEGPQSDLLEVVPIDKATNHLVNPDAPNGSPWESPGVTVTLLGGGESELVNVSGNPTRSLVQFLNTQYNEEWYLDGEFRRKTPADGDFRLTAAEYTSSTWQGASTARIDGDIAVGEDWVRVGVQRRISTFSSTRVRYGIQLVNPSTEDMVIEVRNMRMFQLAAVGGQINMPDLTLGVGTSGGTRFGYRRGSYGTSAPDQLSDGNEIRDLYVNNSNGRLVFRVEGTYPQDEFTSIELVGYGTLNTAAADLFDDSGGETFWRWDGTGITLTDGDTIAVEFT